MKIIARLLLFPLLILYASFAGAVAYEGLPADVIINQQGKIVEQYYDYDLLQFTARGNPNQNFFLNIAKGEVYGTSSQFKFGRSALITSTESVIWDGGGNYTFVTAAELVEIVSDDVADDSVGLGAQTVVIYGLDSNYIEQFEVITMDGTTAVTSTLSYLRLYRALVLTSGTNDPINNSNIGTITIDGATSSTVFAKILPNNGQTLMAVYTVPAGKTAYVTGVSFSTGEGKQCFFKAKFRNGPTSDYAFSVKFTIDLYESHFYGTLVVPLTVPEKTDIVITAQTTVSTVDATASFGLILVDN